MRVIAGTLRGRSLQAPAGLRVRPTSDALRETLFNICGPAVAGSLWVDCCAGTGAVGIEAISRGAAFVYFIETARAARAVLAANLRRLQIGDAAVLSRPALPALAQLAGDERLRAHGGCDFFFFDPPYADAALYAAVLAQLNQHAEALLAPGAWVIVEQARRHELPSAYGGLTRFRQVEQGDSRLGFYRRAAASEPTPPTQ